MWSHAEKPQFWDRLCNIYSVARALPPTEREAFLIRECANDPDLERELTLLLNDRPSSSLQSPPVAQVSTIAAGEMEHCCGVDEVLNDRFRIVKFLGAGGMGEVYQAVDGELGDQVAVKVLRAGRQSEQFSTSSFRREIRLARRITHANVCRVFDFGRHVRLDGVALHYYVMELLEGETLAARLARPEPIEQDMALEIARQMADGLSSAHEAGIVHRDFKPGNVMLMRSRAGLRVAITDFGLAIPAEAGPAMTSIGSTGLLLGTPGYVAPEQVYAGPITPATDIYAYGIVLHELIARVHPRSANAKNVQLPQNWKGVIDRCMDLNPASRFTSARDAYAALIGRISPQRLGFSRRRVLAVAATAAAGAAVYPLVSHFYREYIELPEGALIVVSPVQNSTSDARFNGLTNVLQFTLAQSAHFNIWDIQRLGEVLRSMRRDPDAKLETSIWREIAFREKAPFVIFSSLGQLGTGYVLSVRVELIHSAPEQAARSWDRSFTANGPAALFDAIREAATWIREIGGEDAAGVAANNRLPQDITSPSWEALELFSSAQSLTLAGKTSEAIPLLRRAIELDPQFAMGLMRLGDTLNAQRKSSEGFTYWRKAIDLSKSQRLSEHERFNIESRYAIEVADFPQAEVVLRDWVRKFPNDPLAQQLLASCLISLGQYPEALDWAGRAEARFGPTSFGLGTIIRAQMASNQTGELAASLTRFDSIAPSITALQLRGIAGAIREDYASAEAYFRKMLNSGSREAVSRGTHLLAVLAADQGKFDEAARLFEDGFKQDREAGEHGLASRKAFSLGFLYSARGDRGLARAWSMEAISTQPSPRVLTLVAATLCRADYSDSVGEILKNFPEEDIPRYESARLRIRGELAAAQGKPDHALELLERAAHLEPALTPKEYLAYAMRLARQPERARLLYTQIVNAPYSIWDSADSEWPGIRYLARNFAHAPKGD